MRTDAINASLLETISRARLGKYLHATGGVLSLALDLYERNMRLAEAFYVPLQTIEVTLRNKIDSQMTIVYGPNWLGDAGALFYRDARETIEEARQTASLGRAVITPDDVVAELPFSFWVGLLAKRYDATLWRRALFRAFLAGGGKPRDIVHGRLNAIRRFRNRVAHHEPVFHRPLSQLHGEIVEAIGWMCRDTSAWTAKHSRVQAVLGAG